VIVFYVQVWTRQPGRWFAVRGVRAKQRRSVRPRSACRGDGDPAEPRRHEGRPRDALKKTFA